MSAKRIILVVSWLTMGLTALASQTAGQSGAQAGNAKQSESIGRRAKGVALDVDGKPVIGALIVHQYYVDGKTKDVQTETNEAGEFEIQFPPNPRPFEMYHLWAYKEGFPMRTVALGSRFKKPNEVVSGLEVRFPAKQSFEYHILNNDGSPFADKDVSVRMVNIPNGVYSADEPTGLIGFVPETLQKMSRMKSDQDGRVIVTCMTKRLLSRLMVDSEETGKQEVYVQDKSEESILASVGALKGKFWFDDPSQYEGLTLHVSSRDRIEGKWVSGFAKIEVDAKGEFAVPNLACGDVTIQIGWKEGMDVYPLALPVRAKITEGNVLEVESVREPVKMVGVVGRVKTSDTGMPIVDAKVSVSDIRGRVVPIQITDMTGKFSLQVCEGNVRFQVISLGSNPRITSKYKHPKSLSLEIAKVDESPFELPDFELPLKKVLKGVLLGKDGKPVAEKSIILKRVVYSRMIGRSKTDENGRFEMPVSLDVIGLERQASHFFLDSGKADTSGSIKLEVVDSNEQDLVLKIPN